MKPLLIVLTLCFYSLSSFAMANEHPAEQTSFNEFSATYDLYYGDSKVGEGYRYLYYDDQNTIHYGLISDVQYLFLTDTRAYMGNLMLVGDQIEPISFEEIRTGVGKDYHARISHDHGQNSIHISGYSKRDRNIETKPGATDYVSFQIALRRDLMAGKTSLEYDIVDRRRIKHYSLQRLPETTMQTAVGSLKVIPVTYVHEDKKDDEYWQSTLWFAPQLGYEIVRLDYKDRKGDLVAHIQLSHYQPSVDQITLTEKLRKLTEEEEIKLTDSGVY